MEIFSTLDQLAPLFEVGIEIGFFRYQSRAGYSFLAKSVPVYKIGITTDFWNHMGGVDILREQKITLVHELIHLYLQVIQQEASLGKDAPGHCKWEAEIDAHATRIVDELPELVRMVVAKIAAHPKCCVKFYSPYYDWLDNPTPFAEFYFVELTNGLGCRLAAAQQLTLWDE